MAPSRSADRATQMRGVSSFSTNWLGDWALLTAMLTPLLVPLTVAPVAGW